MNGKAMLVVIGILVVLTGVFIILSSPAPKNNSTVVKLQCLKPCHVDLNDVNSQCIAASEPMFCTLEYRQGDACLQYINCESVGSTCQTTTNSKFTRCISCYQNCQTRELDFET